MFIYPRILGIYTEMLMRLWKGIIVNCLLLLSCTVTAEPPRNFELAKKIAQEIFMLHRQTLYCQCEYDKHKNISLSSCHMESAEQHKRAHKIEWEHMVPASILATGHACWTKDICQKRDGKKYHGRKCCEKIDNVFRMAEAELYNLWPANGLINQFRQNYAYAALPFTDNTYGCRFIIDRKNRLIEPNDSAKGTVARASLFIFKRNHIALAKKQERLFNQWDLLYPPDAWEISWAKRVQEIEGYDNPYISKYYL